mmetsp:Transcript_18944/g.33651  ORF Transcript_18944/g.33651 Transcript_18944/m.33651 type:complete len:82 (+) Transcript_18944:92-337(+)
MRKVCLDVQFELAWQVVSRGFVQGGPGRTLVCRVIFAGFGGRVLIWMLCGDTTPRGSGAMSNRVRWGLENPSGPPPFRNLG